VATIATLLQAGPKQKCRNWKRDDVEEGKDDEDDRKDNGGKMLRKVESARWLRNEERGVCAGGRVLSVEK